MAPVHRTTQRDAVWNRRNADGQVPASAFADVAGRPALKDEMSYGQAPAPAVHDSRGIRSVRSRRERFKGHDIPRCSEGAGSTRVVDAVGLPTWSR